MFKSLKLLAILLRKPLISSQLLTLSRVRNFFTTLFGNGVIEEATIQRYKSIYGLNQTDILEIDETENSKDIIILPVIDWWYRFQRPQQISKHLAKLGYRVFYISTAINKIESAKGYKIEGTPTNGVVIVRLACSVKKPLDFLKETISNPIAQELIISLEKFKLDFRVTDPRIIIQHPYWCELYRLIESDKKIYDCLDLYREMKAHRGIDLERLESDLVNISDETVVTSKMISKALGINERGIVIKNGCEPEKFFKVEPRQIVNRPIIGYVGAISDWFDIDLVIELARNKPDWEFQIIGALENKEIKNSLSLSNIKTFGEIPHTELPRLLKNFDVGIIPFKVNTLTQAVNPVKLYEYLAAGLPVVCTNLAEVWNLGHLDVMSSKSSIDFLENVEKALIVANDPQKVILRQDWAKLNSWEARAKSFLAILEKPNRKSIE